MKVAVLCSGYLRSFKTTISQLKRCILDHFSCDLYLYAVSNEYESDHYVNSRDQHATLLADLQPKMYMFEQASPNETVEERIKQMWFKIYICNQLRHQVELRDGIKYDRVIRIRPDVLLEMDCKEYIISASDAIYLPQNSQKSYPTLELDAFEGYNDQFAVGPSHLMDIYCGVYESIISRRFDAVNSSSLLRMHLANREVREVDIGYKLLLKENIVITVAGDSAAGKTTFCGFLREEFRKQQPQMDILIFECDRYHRWERGHDEWKRLTHLHPDANHLDKMKDDIMHLKANCQITQEDYDHHKGKFTDKEVIHPKSVVLVSGLHSLYDKTLNYMSDMKIYMNPEEHMKVEWKISRDQKERGYSREQVLSAIHVRDRDREMYIKPQKEYADIVLSATGKGGYMVQSKWLGNEIVEMTMEEVFQHIWSHL